MVGSTLFILGKMKQSDTLISEIRQVNRDWAQAYAHTLEFLYHDIKSQEFFHSNRSENLWKVRRILKKSNTQLAELSRDKLIQELELDKPANKVRQSIYKFQTYCRDLESTAINMGFRGNLLIGDIRKNLEKLRIKVPNQGFLVDSLELAQNNFLSSKNSRDGNQVFSIVEALKTTASSNEMDAIHQYASSFDTYFNTIKSLGLNPRSGIQGAINRENELVNRQLLRLALQFETFNAKQEKLLVLVVVVGGTISILISLLLTFVISKNIAKPISDLTTHITENDRQQLEYSPAPLPSNATKEVRLLHEAYLRFMNRIEKQLKDINKGYENLEVRNRELEKLNNELDYFIYHTSHDMRSPVVSILGLIETYQNSEDEDIYEYLEHMKVCADRLEKIIVEIIYFYRNKSTELEASNIAFEPFIRNAFESNKHLAESQQIELVIEEEDSGTIRTDEYGSRSFWEIYWQTLSNTVTQRRIKDSSMLLSPICPMAESRLI